ncbi:hypothetical protein PRIPAC_80346, partial [Pristionchus pacificus]
MNQNHGLRLGRPSADRRIHVDSRPPDHLHPHRRRQGISAHRSAPAEEHQGRHLPDHRLGLGTWSTHGAGIRQARLRHCAVGRERGGQCGDKEAAGRKRRESEAYTVDLSDRKDIAAKAALVKKDAGHVDILINNAGIVTGKKIFECSEELMEKTMAVNCMACLY